VDLPNQGPTAEDLAHWIEQSGENDFIDAKHPFAWDGKDASASLAKDIAAFANSRDGGVLVIGKAEMPDGSYALQGVTAEQADSFDTTVVGQWVNAHFSPPVRLACYRPKYSGRTFVVIVVHEFDDIPSICKKAFQDSTDPRKLLLREGAIYVRTQNAESKPLMNADELRTIVGLTTRKRSTELLAHFEAMLRGRSLIGNGQTPDPFAEEIKQVKADLHCDLSKGAWWMAFHPREHAGELWNSPEALERLVATHSVRIYEEFPGHTKGTFPMPWGIANDLYGETWALTKAGLFCFWKNFRENELTAERTGYRGGDDARKPIPPGEWIEYTWAIRTMVDFFLFLSRFAAAYKPGEEISIDLMAGPLAGRKLATLDFNVALGHGTPEPSRAPSFKFNKVVIAETLQSAWEPICAEALKRLVELFPNHRISVETLAKWIEKFKTRGF